MPGPEQLITHYSHHAFLTRMAALTFVGAIVGATFTDVTEKPTVALVAGYATIVVTWSLATLNLYYTHAFRAACKAACDGAEGERWKDFLRINHRHWGTAGNRFMLLWATYLPGLFVGPYVVGVGCEGGVVAMAWGLSLAVMLSLKGSQQTLSSRDLLP